MDILLIAATEMEIQPAINFLAGNAALPVRHLVTGVGATPTSISLMKSIFAEGRPHLIIQAGVAGAFEAHGTDAAFIVGSDCFADLGVVEDNKFRNIFDLGLSEPDKHPFNKGILTNPYRKLVESFGLPIVNAITVNEITTDRKRIDGYKQTQQPVVESMEGAAFHYVSLIENIPFIQLRTVSNEVGVRDKNLWKLKEAVALVNKELESIIKKVVEYDETYFRI